VSVLFLVMLGLCMLAARSPAPVPKPTQQRGLNCAAGVAVAAC